MRILFLRSMSLIIGSFLMAVLVYSCTRQAMYTIFDSTTIEIIKRTGSSGDQVAYDDDTCKVGSFYVSFSFDFRSISYRSNSDWSFFSTANAFQPGPPIMHSLEKLKDLKFYTVNDFNANYPAGSELTDLVTISTMLGGSTTATFVSIQEFVQKNNEALEKNAYRFPELTLNGGTIRFSELPNSPAYHKFAIKAITEGESLLADTTANVYIIP